MRKRKYVDPKFANDFVRHRILRLFKQGRYHSGLTSERPTKWHPDKVKNPETGKVFTPAECWAFVEKHC